MDCCISEFQEIKAKPLPDRVSDPQPTAPSRGFGEFIQILVQTVGGVLLVVWGRLKGMIPFVQTLLSAFVSWIQRTSRSSTQTHDQDGRCPRFARPVSRKWGSSPFEMIDNKYRPAGNARLGSIFVHSINWIGLKPTFRPRVRFLSSNHLFNS